MHDVVLLSLSDDPGCDCGGACGAPRTQVLTCADALTAAGAQVTTVSAGSDAEIDAALARLDGPARPDGLTWPNLDGPRLIVAAAADGQLRAVVRRMVRRYAPPPSRRPADLRTGRTVPDLPAVGVLPLNRPAEFGLPGDPAGLATAVLASAVTRLDLLRTDNGSVTLQGALVGGTDRWSGRVEVDDTVLATEDEQIMACAVANDEAFATVDGLPLAAGADPADGLITVAVAVPVVVRNRLGRRQARIEVRRARGRAVSVTPVGEVPFLDDGVSGTLGRKRSWWAEPGALGVYRS